MLQRMYVADADGVCDRLVDFTTPVTGTNFFAPSLDVLEALADPATQAASAEVSAADTVAPAATPPAADPAALGIGDLRGGRGLI